MARPRGNRWQADAVIGGQRVRKSFQTREAAEEYERLASLGAPGEFTLKAFAEANFDAIWGENSYTEGNKRLLGILYRSFGQDCPLVNLDTHRIDQALAEWKSEGLAASTINHRLSTLSKLLKYARRKGVVTHLPDIQRQRVDNLLERVWSKEDERKANLFLDHTGMEKAKWIIQFLLYTGARKGEAYLLKRQNVRDGWITFDRRTTKNGKTRQIPMVPKAKEAWDALCHMSNLESPLRVLPRPTLTDHWNLLRAHFEAEDDRAFVPHMLRHTCATRLVAAGVPLPQVMKWMGHQSISVTMRYVYVAPKDLDVAAQALAA